MFRVLDEDNVMMLGSVYTNFYVKGRKEPIIQIGYSDNQDEDQPDPKDLWPPKPDAEYDDIPYKIQILPTSYSYKLTNTYEVGLYSYLGITDPSDPIKTAQEIANLPKDKLLTLKFGPESCSIWKLTAQIDGPRYMSGNGAIIEPKCDHIIGHISSIVVNNDYYLHCRDNETRLVHGILPTENCPYVFVPINKDNDDYIFCLNHVKKEWKMGKGWYDKYILPLLRLGY